MYKTDFPYLYVDFWSVMLLCHTLSDLWMLFMFLIEIFFRVL